MNPKKLYVGKNLMEISEKTASGAYVCLNGEIFYKIQNFNDMKPFFMSIVSDCDHWMFLSSLGSLTAGRKNPGCALFPYYTVDKIHDSHEITGSKTLLKITVEDKTFLWEPFSDKYAGIYAISRNIYKNITGNRVLFEEINQDLKIVFRYSWSNSDRFGFIRKSEIENLADDNRRIELLDGIQNILPFGVNANMQNDKSPLVEAYKKSELITETGVGVYVLSSIPVDRAEPSEALRATSVWSVGEHIVGKLLSSSQLDQFRKGYGVVQEEDIRACRGAYFVEMQFELKPSALRSWYIIAEVSQSSAKIADLNYFIKNNTNLAEQLEADIAIGTQNLTKLVANADGLQLTNDQLTVQRQFANVLFNIMRGGIFADGYLVSQSDFCLFVKGLNRKVYDRHETFLNTLPPLLHHSQLTELLAQKSDAGLLRAGLEYLPLTFSRRHGDPSRPWNLFSIETRTEDGKKILNYQGNWRDIFQNWEALCLSFPGFVDSMISKFVNASTAEGYNPYRITRDGFDWEIHDPSDPWSFIGYWGDHQVIYLLKFLEIIERYYPEKLDQLLTHEIFSYANVPYRIKSYEAILSDPHHTINYDKALEELILQRVKELGSDGKMILSISGEVYYVNLTEKLLLTALAKLANFIPEGGIWMNTQRPEWNDANNALVGTGVSMVTLYYLRRYIHFCLEHFKKVSFTDVQLSCEVATFLTDIHAAFDKNAGLLKIGFNDKTRKELLDLLGTAASSYRDVIYKQGFSERKVPVTIQQLTRFFQLTLEYLDHSIKANCREDKLYHAYNILSIQGKEMGLSHLHEMLEGQVAILSSGYLSPTESATLLDSLKRSAMFWPEEYSYRLYPDKRLPRFTEKNNIPHTLIASSPLLLKLLKVGDTSVIEKDVTGNFHFHGSFTNKQLLAQALNKLDKRVYGALVSSEGALLLDAFENMFDHKSFTGRSGTFFGYEGLGCIYWHMVSKLLVAVEEVCYQANAAGESTLTHVLTEHYYDIRKGLGLNKTPPAYGAFPTDPYSHTPGQHGAQQPGMTGQVKEDIISRFAELGVLIKEGKIHFSGVLLQKSEFLSKPSVFRYFDALGIAKELPLETGSLAFTLCQVPVIYRLSDKEGINFVKQEQSCQQPSLILDEVVSHSIFQRKGEIQYVEVNFKQ